MLSSFCLISPLPYSTLPHSQVFLFCCGGGFFVFVFLMSFCCCCSGFWLFCWGGFLCFKFFVWAGGRRESVCSALHHLPFVISSHFTSSSWELLICLPHSWNAKKALLLLGLSCSFLLSFGEMPLLQSFLVPPPLLSYFLILFVFFALYLVLWFVSLSWLLHLLVLLHELVFVGLVGLFCGLFCLGFFSLFSFTT